MSRQVGARKEILIVGDSNIERNLLHTGRLYCEHAESVAARNIVEFNNALSQIQADKYKVVVFAMMTNLVVSAGDSVPSLSLAPRLTAVETCLKSVIRTIT